MGEIGINRKEFLYEINFWEVRRIIRGYRRRGRLEQQLLAENVFASTFAFRGSEGKTVKDLFPSLFKDDEEFSSCEYTEEDQKELLALLDNVNAELQTSREQ